MLARSTRKASASLLRHGPVARRHSIGGLRGNHTKDEHHVREIVRKYDYDNYVCGLLLPHEVRPSFFAIRAANAEIAMIKDTIRTNHMTGKIRMQWWREKIYDLYTPEPPGGRPAQQTLVLRELETAVHTHGLTRRWFERLLDARDQDLDTDQPQSLEEIEMYAEKTAGSLLYLTLECLGVRDDVADRVAGHAGIAIGLATLLRGTYHHSAHQQLYLPQDLLMKHNITEYDLFDAVEDPEKGKQAASVVFEVACRAMDHLREARALRKDLPKPACAAMLATVSTGMYLNELEKVNFNAFDPALMQRSPLQYHFEVLKYYFLRKY